MHVRKRSVSLIAICGGAFALALAVVIAGCGGGNATSVSADKVALGRALFNEKTLSVPSGLSCGTCHQEATAFADPRIDTPTSEGAVAGRFGKRQTPSINYLAFSPNFHFDTTEQDYIGGQFWDGRAIDLKDQVHFPVLNNLEMNNATKADVIAKLSSSRFAPTITAIYGQNIFANTDQAFDAIADAIAAFEMSKEVNPFTSKYDYYLKGRATLTDSETRGLAVFSGKAKCTNCHPATPAADGSPPLLTDFTYDNVGLPRNPQNKFFTLAPAFNPDGQSFADVGLMQTTNRPEDIGRFKVPTLRNIALTAPYFHNGVVATLEQAVQFYNKRDLGAFPAAEFPGNMNLEELGNLNLTDQEVSDIVAFMNTLTDGYVPR